MEKYLYSIIYSFIQIYDIQLMNDGKSKDSFDIISGRNKSVTLYPGNIAFYQPEVRQLVTVFGRLKSPNGELLKYASNSKPYWSN